MMLQGIVQKETLVHSFLLSSFPHVKHKQEKYPGWYWLWPDETFLDDANAYNLPDSIGPIGNRKWNQLAPLSAFYRPRSFSLGLCVSLCLVCVCVCGGFLLSYFYRERTFLLAVTHTHTHKGEKKTSSRARMDAGWIPNGPSLAWRNEIRDGLSICYQTRISPFSTAYVYIYKPTE